MSPSNALILKVPLQSGKTVKQEYFHEDNTFLMACSYNSTKSLIITMWINYLKLNISADRTTPTCLLLTACGYYFTIYEQNVVCNRSAAF